MLLIGLLDILVKTSPADPHPAPIATFSSGSPFPCRVFDSDEGQYGYGVPIPGAWCVPLLYAPANVSDVKEIMTTLAARNGYQPPVQFEGDLDEVGPPSACQSSPTASSGAYDSTCVLGFQDVDSMRRWLGAHKGRAGFGIVWGDTTETTNADGSTSIAQEIGDALPAKEARYEIWYNGTALTYKFYATEGIDRLGEYTDIEAVEPSFRYKDTSLMFSVQRAVDEAIIGFRAAQAGRSEAVPELEIALKPYPRLKDERGIGETFSGFSVFISLIFSFMYTHAPPSPTTLTLPSAFIHPLFLFHAHIRRPRP